MSTTTSTATYTITQTAVYLTDVILGAISDVLGELGINATRLYTDWDQDQAAIKAWIKERSLEQVILECHQPSGKVAPVIEFPVTYVAGGTGDRTFTADRAGLARYRAKIERVPTGTTFRLFCTFRTARTAQPGWNSGTRADTSGLRSLSFGTLATGSDAQAAMRYLRWLGASNDLRRRRLRQSQARP